MYALNQNYRGESRRNVKTYGPKRHAGRGRKGRLGQRGNRRLSSVWVRGEPACFVFGKDHRANHSHLRDEVAKATRRFKGKHPKPLSTVEEMAFATNLMNEEPTDEEEGVFA